MYIIKDIRNNTFLTDNGWTTISKSPKSNATYINGLEDVLRFTKGESLANKLPLFQVWVHFPSIAPIKE